MRFRWLLLYLVVGLMVGLMVSLPSLRHGSDVVDFVGTDDRAVEAIRLIAPGYQPWVDPVFEPEERLESWLFRLQALAGGGLLAYSLYRLIRRGGRQLAGKRVPH